ncbi:alginate lyase family protein [Archangium primigenium]|uniref:alginate lyase family protein n=1 Tax=[Archangium] primigenium TaxID=2792470 RepID=UPI00195BDBB8|nr:alginate lyase family protein [Archangium primigenium]MBM7115022.1 alginate lyase family protein [Archangium primigenium]
MGTLGYYSTIARLAPVGLARGMVRRVHGKARQALYKQRERLDERGVLAAFGVTSAEALAERALAVRPGGAWCEVGQRDSARTALEAVEGGVERALERAEAALRGEYHVFGVPVCFGEGQPVDWSLDVGSGYRYPVVPVERLKLAQPGVDPKFPWELGRLDCLVALGQGYWVARDEARRRAFARAFVLRALDFLQANPVGEGVQWTCPMDVALRGANLAQALRLFADAPEARRPEFLVPVLQAIAEHAAWVETHLEDGGAVPNNHLVSNFVGLLVMGLLFPELPDAERQTALAVAGLRTQVAAQVHADGSSFEGSIPYHRLSVELFTLALVVARTRGVDLGSVYEQRLLGMFKASRCWTSEHGLAPQVGDNDSGRVFPFREREGREQGYLAPLGAALFGDVGLGGGDFPDEAAWLLGRPGLERFRASRPAPAPVSTSFPEGGFHVLRGAGAVVTVSAGAQGQGGVGGHSHNDKLSFELHLDGRPVIVDPGTGTYTREPAVRNALRSTASHNTLQVDGTEQAPLEPHRLFALPESARARVQVFQTGGELERLHARHDGYRVLSAPVAVERTFLLDKRERALGIVETLVGVGLHEVTGRLHLPDREARLSKPTAGQLARASRVPEAPRSFEAIAVELGPEDSPVAMVLFQEGVCPRLETSRYSPGYGLLVESRVVVFGATLSPPACLRWVVVFG